VSSGGVFDISIDGAIAYSKRNSGRFPEIGDLENLLP